MMCFTRNACENTNKHQESPEQYLNSNKYVKSSQNELTESNSLFIKKAYFTMEKIALLEIHLVHLKICVVVVILNRT